MGDALSIRDAARELPDGIAIETASRTYTFRDCAAALPEPRRSVIATPSVDTVLAIHAALEARTPLALVHHRLASDEQARQAAAATPADITLFTSGSTGAPKPVPLSRTMMLAAAGASARHLGWRDDDRWLLALSMAHAGGLAVVVRCLVARKPIVLAEDLLDRCTLASLVPTQLAALLDDPAWRPPRRLRALLLGGAAAPRALLVRAAERGVPFLATYGMTETFGQVATAPLERAGDPDAPLVPLPGIALEAGTRDEPAPIRVGDLVTADLGYLEAGALHVVGRCDDVIITGGENVHPAMVEAVIATTPGVRAACAFGVPDERWGQVIAVALVTDAAFSLRAAVARWRAALPSHARPRRFALCDALPLLPTGKIDRRAAARLPVIEEVVE